MMLPQTKGGPRHIIRSQANPEREYTAEHVSFARSAHDEKTKPPTWGGSGAQPFPFLMRVPHANPARVSVTFVTRSRF